MQLNGIKYNFGRCPKCARRRPINPDSGVCFSCGKHWNDRRMDLYIFNSGKLQGIHSMDSATIEQIENNFIALQKLGLTGILSDKGRAICCVCKLDLGERDLPAGKISHSYCESCYTAAMADCRFPLAEKI